MITLDDFASVPPGARGAYLAIGNFDGVHRGHAHLLGRLRARADAAGVPALVLTFDPPPVTLLRPEATPPPLTWLARKVDLLERAGVSEVGVFRTGPWLLGLTAREFFDRVIRDQFAARGLVEGPTFTFGRDRGGDVQSLASWCAAEGLDFEVAPPTEVDGRIVSSSRIRRALAEGLAEEAALLLGRPHRLRGVVVHGAGRGAGLGFPTANLDRIDAQVPADGVYAAKVLLDGRVPTHPAACHIGANVSFGASARTVEVHLINFQGDLYGRSLEIDLLSRLRPSRKFADLADLLVQIRLDVARALALTVAS